jgi:hypothetical protein
MEDNKAGGRRGKRQSGGGDEEATKVWTAASCNRLLRSLTSRIELLKKDAELYLSAFGEDKTAPCNEEDESANATEPKSIFGPEQKRKIKTTYGGRNRNRPGNSASIPTSSSQVNAHHQNDNNNGEFLIPTPLLTRHQWTQVDSSTNPLQPPALQKKTKSQHHMTLLKLMRTRADLSNRSSEAKVHIDDLRGSMSARKFELHLAIFDALDKILDATKPTNLEKSAKSSLFQTCLRNMHQRITLEEQIEKEDAAFRKDTSIFSRRDVSGEVYGQLESLGQYSDKGWKPLKTMVRGQAIAILAEAMGAHLISKRVGPLLVDLCYAKGSDGEAEILATALLGTQKFIGPGGFNSVFTDRPQTALLDVLNSEDGFCRNGQTRILTNLLTNNNLPILWLGTHILSGIWPGSIDSISQSPIVPEAVDFLNVGLPKICCGMPSKKEALDLPYRQKDIYERLEQIFSSMMSTIVSLIMLDDMHLAQQFDHPDTFEERSRTLRKIMKLLCLHLSKHGTLINSRSHREIALASVLIASPSEMEQNCPPTFGYLHHKKNDEDVVLDVDDGRPRLICSIARCCGRTKLGNDIEFLKIICGKLEAYAESLPEDEAIVMKTVIVDAAHLFSLSSHNPKAADYADEICLKLLARHSYASGESEVERTGFYRWEESIGEWVVPTPALEDVKQKQKWQNIRQKRLNDEEGKKNPPRAQDVYDGDSDLETPVKQRGKNADIPESVRYIPRLPSHRTSGASMLSNLIPLTPGYDELQGNINTPAPSSSPSRAAYGSQSDAFSTSLSSFLDGAASPAEQRKTRTSGNFNLSKRPAPPSWSQENGPTAKKTKTKTTSTAKKDVLAESSNSGNANNHNASNRSNVTTSKPPSARRYDVDAHGRPIAPDIARMYQRYDRILETSGMFAAVPLDDNEDNDDDHPGEAGEIAKPECAAVWDEEEDRGCSSDEDSEEDVEMRGKWTTGAERKHYARLERKRVRG